MTLLKIMGGNMKIKKYEDDFWNFVGADTKEYTHSFHVYPAMMIPQVAREILNRYKTDYEAMIT